MVQSFRPKRRPKRPDGEPTLPLINIVFLMLVFFLAAAQLARPLSPDLQLIDTDDPSATPPPDAVVLRADGQVSFRGAALPPQGIVALLRQSETDAPLVVRVVPDRRSDAIALTDLGNALRQAGAFAVHIVTERRQQ